MRTSFAGLDPHARAGLEHRRRPATRRRAHAARELARVEDRRVGSEQAGLEAIGAHQGTELGAVDEPHVEAHRAAERGHLGELLHLRPARRHAQISVALEVAVDAILRHQLLDRHQADGDRVVDAPRRLGAVRHRVGGETHVGHVREAAVASARAVAAAGAFETHDARAGRASRERRSRCETREAATDDRDVRLLGAAQRWAQRLLAQTRAVHPVAVDEVLVQHAAAGRDRPRASVAAGSPHPSRAPRRRRPAADRAARDRGRESRYSISGGVTRSIHAA